MSVIKYLYPSVCISASCQNIAYMLWDCIHGDDGVTKEKKQKLIMQTHFQSVVLIMRINCISPARSSSPISTSEQMCQSNLSRCSTSADEVSRMHLYHHDHHHRRRYHRGSSSEMRTKCGHSDRTRATLFKRYLFIAYSLSPISFVYNLTANF